jgi:hypothetical protein
MHFRHTNRNADITRRLAVEAARIMADQSIQDFSIAKRKAAERLNIRDPSLWPKNTDIEEALLEHRRLFNLDNNLNTLHELRRCAFRLMQLLQQFQPHLVGSVLSGSADRHSEICLHVFTDEPEQVLLHLLERGIQSQHAEKKAQLTSDRLITLPCFKFIAGQHPIELVVFPVTGLKQAPISPVNHKPMLRANLQAVKDLLK